MAVNYQAPTFSGGTPSSLALTQAFADVELALRNAIGINGDLPNAMEEDLDLNGHKLLNVGKIGSVLVDSDDLNLVLNRVVANEADIATLQGLRALDQILLSQTIARLDDLQEIEVIEGVLSRLSSVETDIDILKATDNDLVPRVTALEGAPSASETLEFGDGTEAERNNAAVSVSSWYQTDNASGRYFRDGSLGWTGPLSSGTGTAAVKNNYVLGIIGQSNARGSGDSPSGYTNKTEMRDVVGNLFVEDPVLYGVESPLSDLWVSPENIILVKQALGGISAQTFIDNHLPTYLSNLALSPQTSDYKHVSIWLQGENEAQAGVSQAVYQALEAQIFDAIKAAQPDMHFYTTLISPNVKASLQAGYSAINAAKVANAAARTDVTVLAGPWELGPDALHYEHQGLTELAHDFIKAEAERTNDRVVYGILEADSGQAQSGFAVANATEISYAVRPFAAVGERRLGTDGKPYEFVTGDETSDPAYNWINGTWKFVGKSELPEDLPSGHTALTLDDITPDIHYLRYDILENGAGSLEIPVGLPIHQEIHIRIPAFSPDTLFTGQIGSGTVELIADNNGRFSKGSDRGFEVSDVAGTMILRKTEDKLWKRDFQVPSSSEAGVRYSNVIPFGVVSTSGDTFSHLIRIFGSNDYTMDYGEGGPVALTGGAVRDHTYSADFDGEATLTLGEGSYPAEIFLYRENYKDPVDFFQRLNARNTLTDIRMDLSAPDFNLEDMTAGATNIENFTSRAPAGLNVQGSLGEAMYNMESMDRVNIISAIATEDTATTFFKGFRNQGTYCAVISDEMVIDGDHGEGLTHMDGTFDTFTFDGDKVSLYGDFAESHRADKIEQDSTYSFRSTASRYTGTVNNSNDFFKKLTLFRSHTSPLSTYGGSWNTALTGCPQLEYIDVSAVNATTDVDFGTLLDEIPGEYTFFNTGTATASCSKAPAFPAEVKRFDITCSGLTSAEVDLIFEGLANNVTTWANGTRIVILGNNAAPTALTTGTGGYIDQIVATASPSVLTILHK